MADALEDSDKLFARADAAIAESRRLAQASVELQHGLEARIRRMYFRATFYPHSLRFYSPLDFVQRPPRPYQPFPSETDSSS